MDIKDIDANSKDVEVEAKVVEVEDVREVNTRFGQKKVCAATIEDSTGKIKLSVWEDQIKLLKEGKTVKVTSAYANEWRDELQLNLSRNSIFEVVD